MYVVSAFRTFSPYGAKTSSASGWLMRRATWASLEAVGYCSHHPSAHHVVIDNPRHLAALIASR